MGSLRKTPTNGKGEWGCNEEKTQMVKLSVMRLTIDNACISTARMRSAHLILRMLWNFRMRKKKKCMVYCSATKVMQNMSCKNAIISIQMNSFPLNVLFVYSKVYSDGAWCLPFKTLQWFRREFFELYIYRYLQFSQGLFSLFGTGREELRFKDISITPCS